MKTKRINSIDILKALAIILVVWFHFQYQATGDNALRIWGFMGVSIFFIASGFLLS
jgi:peptidoglycan/LPS O-acetylase OafA/YrhL